MTNGLTLNYKGKSVVVLTEQEVVNNTHDGLVQTGVLMDRVIDALADLGLLKDIAT